MPLSLSQTEFTDHSMALAFQSTATPHTHENPSFFADTQSPEARLNQALSLLEYKVQQLAQRQHQALMPLYQQLEEVKSTPINLFNQSEQLEYKALIEAELEAVNAREFAVRQAALEQLAALHGSLRAWLHHNP
jgi:hypothetical protein